MANSKAMLLRTQIKKWMKAEVNTSDDSMKRSFNEARLIKDMARATGRDTSTIRKILDGTIAEPPMEVLSGIASVFDKSGKTLEKAKTTKPLNRKNTHG